MIHISKVCLTLIIWLLSSTLAAQGYENQTEYLELPSFVAQKPIGSMASQSLNVFKQPLKLFSQQPMTGYFRDGYCRTGSVADPGNHAVAGVVTDEFLDFSASRGNDLRTVGLKGGCKWCLCTSRWLEAYQAHRAGKVSALGVPRVDLEATEDSALKQVHMETFRQFATSNGNGSGVGGSSASS